jgi:hypothetical protein
MYIKFGNQCYAQLRLQEWQTKTALVCCVLVTAGMFNILTPGATFVLSFRTAISEVINGSLLKLHGCLFKTLLNYSCKQASIFLLLPW